MVGKGVCRYFGSPKGCHYGKNCKFSHQTSPKSDNAVRDSSSTNNGPTEVIRWLYQIPRTSEARPLGRNLAMFFQQGLTLVNKGPETGQEVVTRLASEGGLQRLQEVITHIQSSANDNLNGAFSALFVQVVLPMFQILTHASVASSLLLEQPLATILNFLYGPSGRRATTIFTFVVRVMVISRSEAHGLLNRSAYEAVTSLFSRIVDANGNAIFVEELEEIAGSLEQELNSIEDRVDCNFLLMSRGFMDRALDRFNAGKSIPEARSTSGKPEKFKAKFELQKDAPGWLSSLGPRHDNDHEDIHDIKILPTATELQSDRLEYLPTIDPAQWHALGVHGLLDRHFRLLREDTIGQVRDAIKLELDAQKEHAMIKKDSRLQNTTRIFNYRNATACDFRFHETRGLDLIYRFDQPAQTRKMSLLQRKDWWQFSRRMQHGALVCLLDATATPIFCVVSDTGLALTGDISKGKQEETSCPSIYARDDFAYVTLSLIDTNAANLNLILQGFISGHGRGSEDLIEFPNILLPSFKPILESLQRRSLKGALPFHELLVPSDSKATELYDMRPPEYARRADFKFDLSCVTRGSPLTLSINEPFDVSKLREESSLDDAQAKAFINALRRCVALIQGPPGTGKSYTGVALIKTLLANRQSAHLGPIVCVCMTNHALDQLLEALLDNGVKQIIRIGSRSKSERLEEVNLRRVVREAAPTRTERQEVGKIRSSMKQHLTGLNRMIGDFGRASSTDSIRSYLAVNFPDIVNELFQSERLDEYGFEKVTRHPIDPLQEWLHPSHEELTSLPVGLRPRPVNDLRYMSLHSMTVIERQMLFESWVSDIRADIKSNIEGALDDYLKTRERLIKARQEADLRCLQNAFVVGVTTTGLARITDLLSRLNSKILVCEEAAEVLEAHILTALLPNIEHLILIGDHLQLRPQIANYNLSSENPQGAQFSLDMSLFERLVLPPTTTGNAPHIPFDTLETQRRMSPSIAELVRSQLYPQLNDASSVQSYPEVVGMRQRLFWMDHNNKEAGAEDDQLVSTSHSNDFEVEIVTALVSHIARQGVYKTNQIAVLTPYLGQLRKLRSSLASEFTVVIDDRDIDDLEKDGLELHVTTSSNQSSIHKSPLLKTLRVATVDNFQGEEAEVVIVSLVRCNDQNRCGFLRTSNRINVLLSRAKHGMYVIGNARTAATVPMWANVIDKLRQQGSLGPALELTCPRHPETPIFVRNMDEFNKFSPEAGCTLRCDRRLPCGHACIQRCHSQPMHLAVKCLEPCQRRIKGCSDHPCPRKCGDTCPEKCRTIKPAIPLPCGHIRDLECHEARDREDAKCRERITMKVAGCGHIITEECWKEAQIGLGLPCPAKCDTVLECGHKCMKKCSECRNLQDSRHRECKQVCGKPYADCGHKCERLCHGSTDCPLCEAPCDIKCSHSSCAKKCFEACTPCSEQSCFSCCPHSQCIMPCAVPCTWIPCSRRCEKTLECGHRCPSVCGERCPQPMFCQICANDDIKDLQVDFIMQQTYAEINLEEDPCLFTQCGHIVTMSNLDGHFNLSEHYVLSNDGSISEIKPSERSFSTKDHMKRCPHCRGSLRDVARYGRIVRRALLDESSKRFIKWATAKHARFETEIQNIKENMSVDSIDSSDCMIDAPLCLGGDRSSQFNTLNSLTAFSKFFKKAMRARQHLNQFAQKVAVEEQPYHQVRNLVENLRKRGGVDVSAVPNDIATVYHSNFIRVTALLLRFDLWILSKAIECKKRHMYSQSISTTGEFVIDMSPHRTDCENLIAICEKTVHPAQQVEGHILYAQYVALENSVAGLLHTATNNTSEGGPELRALGLAHLSTAHQVIERYPTPTEVYILEMEATEKMLKDTFYTAVSDHERKEILTAMAAEFRGTGHWYTCANGHAFTVGECGMPMEEARCPQCGAPVGGQNHESAEGVRRAKELEHLLSEMQLGN